MSKRGRVVLMVLAFAVAAAGLAQTFRLDLAAARERVSAETIDHDLHALDVTLADWRAAQAGYVAVGQGPGPWMSRAAEIEARLEASIGRVEAASTDAEAKSHYEAAAAALSDMKSIDRRARAFVSADQRLLASDLVFMDAAQAAQRLGAAIEAARNVEHAAAESRVILLGRYRIIVAGVTLLWTLIVTLVFFRKAGPKEETAPQPATKPMTPVGELLSLQPAAPPRIREPLMSAIDLTDAAELCIDLARVIDSRDVPALLERAAHVLNAKGLVLWAADTAGAHLRPTLTHGYPERVVNRLGDLQVDADNATALAFRSMRPQVVNARNATGAGAIAVPLVTAGGCVGVLAAEIKLPKPGKDTTAVARIIAAQLAALVGPVESAQKTAQA